MTIRPIGVGVAVVVAATLVAIITINALRGTGTVTASPSPTSSFTPTAFVTVAPTVSAAAPRVTASPTPAGTITGHIGYPSEFLPPVTVYAISVSDANVWFATSTPLLGNARVSPSPGASPSPTWPPGTDPGTYRIAVSPGTYYVIAFRDDTGASGPRSAGYTQSTATCPASGPCSSDHSLVRVTVAAGQTVANINIQDWFLQGATYPARPTPR